MIHGIKKAFSNADAVRLYRRVTPHVSELQFQIQNATRGQMMKKPHVGLYALAALSLALLPSVHAQTATVVAKPARPFGYDITKEVTLSGTVAGAPTNTTPETMNAFQFLLTTSSDTVNVNLGIFERGEGAISVALGKQIEVTGVMKNLNGSRILLARILKVGSRTYTIRNERGIPMAPQTKLRVAKKTAQNAGAL